MNERLPCEFFLVRYVPDRAREESVNIGVLLREAGRPESAIVRFTKDWSRVRCMDPDADIATLEALESEVRRRLLENDQPILKTLHDSFSHLLQIAPSKGSLAESMPAEIDLLMQLYVEPRKRQAAERRGGRAAIHARMRTEFERAGVWDLLRKRIAAATYTRPGDSLRIDCGYRPNGTLRMFHAVSLEGDSELAKVLAFSAPGIDCRGEEDRECRARIDGDCRARKGQAGRRAAGTIRVCSRDDGDAKDSSTDDERSGTGR